MDSLDRSWMYDKHKPDGLLDEEFAAGVEKFVRFAISKPDFMNGQEIRCPCKKCDNRLFLRVNDVRLHLYKDGFVSNYFEWIHHGEPHVSSCSRQGEGCVDHEDFPQRVEPISPFRQMIFDVAGPEVERLVLEEPNAESKFFFDLLHSLDEELWPGCDTHSVLSIIARLLSIKSENHLSEKCFDSFLAAMKEALPPDNKLASSFYETKKLVRGLGLPVEKIDCCPQGCMLYWREDSELSSCKFCRQPRFKPRRGSGKQKAIPNRTMFYFPLTPRLRRLYASKTTAADMRWHHEHAYDDVKMCHPCDSEAWKHFNRTNTSFASEPRNIRLGLSTDGFQPFGQSGQQYSCWPVIVTPYNLPPWSCMKEQYMFLTVLVPGPNNPKHKIDVFLQPLIAELIDLWENGVDAYDVSRKQNFNLRAALMWTVSDFPAYSMLSGWSTAGKHACPYCMENSQAFYLPNGHKTCWFDNHRQFLPSNHTYRRNKTKFRANRVENTPPPPIKTSEQIFNKIEELGLLTVIDPNNEVENKRICRENCGWKRRSIFWDLPYWRTNLIRHNLDVMHIEKNVFENVFNTVMDIPGKTKDNSKAREDLKLFCRRHELAKDPQSNKYPKACYSLDQRQRKMLCEWVKLLKFPDGYVSNLGRCVDMHKYKLFGMKSHDCHVFMQRLLPIAFRELLPKQIWEAITELCLFFKNLSANVITVDDMERLEEEIPIILCKLETIFPPGFFDSMEHLPVNLPYEAKIAGPVQFRWMYPFERYLRHLKKNVKNKARVEGSICNAYLVEEASNFCSHYFERQVYSRYRKVPRNDDGGDRDSREDTKLIVFSHNGRAYGRTKSWWLEDEEYEAAHTYILLNCPEVKPYLEMFMNHLREINPGASDSTIQTEVEKNFASWFLNYGRNNTINNKCVRDLVYGPAKGVKSFLVYFINGYRFHTESHGGDRSTSNSGVCVIGDGYEYYGVIEQIIEVEYAGLPLKRTVLFKCHWYDPTPNIGIRIHPRYNIVEVNKKRKFSKFEPFILALQATQVYYVTYPSLKRDKMDWLVACSVKARGIFDIPNNKLVLNQEEEAFQEDNAQPIAIETSDADGLYNLGDPNNELVDFQEEESEEEDFEFITDSDEDRFNDEDLIEYDDND